MMVDDALFLKRLLRKYKFIRTVEVSFWSAAVGVVCYYALSRISDTQAVPIFLAFCLAFATAIIVIRRLHLISTNENHVALYLNRRYPELMESVDLLSTRTNALSIVQELQKHRVIEQLEKIYPQIRVPHRLWLAVSGLVLSLLLSAAISSFVRPSQKQTTGNNDISSVQKKRLPSDIADVIITVSPQAYTQMRNRTTKELDLEVSEGSAVAWTVSFKGPVSEPKIIFSASDTSAFMLSAGGLRFEKTLYKDGFYQLRWTNPDSTITYSDFYRLNVIEDLMPTIELNGLNQHVELKHNDNLTVNVNAQLSDDYGLRDANIVATVSKGSGEAIKFREEHIRFQSPTRINGKRVNASHRMNLRNLGMEPGDELYFYVQAIDNKTPNPHRARSETYFISLQDTSALANTLDASLGADVMPDYFRSQRQIIIDTEKLLAQKSKISRQVFNERSNALAHDQKVLRLRYGEFLGEEFESGIGPSSAVSGESANDIQKEFRHDHDADDDRHLDNSDGHVDNNKPTDGQKENALEEFVHAHDGEEEATFFVQSIKAKLKAAISIMWDAELHLRLFEPKTSLPFQYKALKLLKEISQESRIYVHRSGFDPPPLKEESRLTGDLSEIQNSKYESITKNKNIPQEGVSIALSLIDQFIVSDTIWNDRDTKDIFIKAGQELAVLELKQPGRYLKALSTLKILGEHKSNSIIDDKTLVDLRAALWKALPQSIEGPNSKSATMHDLDQQFLKNLVRLQQNP